LGGKCPGFVGKCPGFVENRLRAGNVRDLSENRLLAENVRDLSENRLTNAFFSIFGSERKRRNFIKVNPAGGRFLRAILKITSPGRREDEIGRKERSKSCRREVPLKIRQECDYPAG
jgi:hypothetical protein